MTRIIVPPAAPHRNTSDSLRRRHSAPLAYGSLRNPDGARPSRVTDGWR